MSAPSATAPRIDGALDGGLDGGLDGRLDGRLDGGLDSGLVLRHLARGVCLSLSREGHLGTHQDCEAPEVVRWQTGCAQPAPFRNVRNPHSELCLDAYAKRPPPFEGGPSEGGFFEGEEEGDSEEGEEDSPSLALLPQLVHTELFTRPCDVRAQGQVHARFTRESRPCSLVSRVHNPSAPFVTPSNCRTPPC